jgi:hypothetical protein
MNPADVDIEDPAINHFSQEEEPVEMSSDVIEGQDHEDIFRGDYEEFIEPIYYPKLDVDDPGSSLDQENISSDLKPIREQLFKIIITKQKKEFEAPTSFSEKNPGEEGSATLFEVKAKPNEYQTLDKAYIEYSFQTANKAVDKSYQVPKMRTKNSFTQVESHNKDIKEEYEKKARHYLTNPNKLQEIENFLIKTRSLVEQTLQSNETIDIFQNDFDLDRNQQVKTEEEKKEKKNEQRTFKANSKNQKRSVNYIRFIAKDEVYVAHSLMRNLSIEERIKVIGIPYTSQIFFWNFANREINSPVFLMDIPMEVTAFEFCPSNMNKMVAALTSGQIIVFEIKDLLGLLNKGSKAETMSIKKGK